MNEQQAYGDMMAAEGALKQYQDPNLTTQINQNVQNQWSPLLQNAAQATQDKMANFNNDYWSKLGYGALEGGTDAASLNPQQKLQVMGQGLGDMVGSLNYSSSLADMLGGKASEMAQRAREAAQFGYTTAADGYNRAAQRYQLALQQAEAQRAAGRAAADRQAMISALGLQQDPNALIGAEGEDDVIEVPDVPSTFDRSIGARTKDISPMGVLGDLYNSQFNVPGLVGAYLSGGNDGLYDEYARVAPNAYSFASRLAPQAKLGGQNTVSRSVSGQPLKRK